MDAPDLQPVDRTPPAVNVAARLAEIAQKLPDAIAVACPGRGDVAGQNTYNTCTFAELERDSLALARGLVRQGCQPGTRLVLLVQPGVVFVKLVFALLRSGATALLIDPGMGRRHLVNCLAAAEPKGFVALSAAQAIRSVLRRRFPQADLNVTVGRRWFWGGPTYDQLLRLGQQSQATLPTTQATDPAAIIFTSGSTGPPKGVLYTHQMFDTQAVEIRRQYDLQPGGADLACFPLFGLFNSVMGVTTVFPQMDFARPAAADPRRLLSAARDWQVTQAFASPAVWNKLSQYCTERGEMIPTLHKVFSCGAPVPATTLRRTLACAAANAQMHTPYGATESLPVATIEAREVLDETAEHTDRGQGICVGRKFDTIEWQVIPITDEPLTNIEPLPPGEIGELIVRGPQVSPEYVVGELRVASCEARVAGDQTRASRRATHDSSEGRGAGKLTRNSQLATRNSKIATGNSVWHRLGDVGYLDAAQRFWYCGRKAQRVVTAGGTLFTIPCEAVFNTHPLVMRSALVGVGVPGGREPVMVIETDTKNTGQVDHERIAAELSQLARQFPHTAGIRQFLFYPSLPVDVRHNSKINREQLAHWARQQLQK